MVNVSPQYAYTLTNFFRNEVNYINEYHIIFPDRKTYKAKTLEEEIKDAVNMNARYLLNGTVESSGNRVTVYFTMYDALSGKPVWTGSVKKQKSEKLELILIRFAQRLGTNLPLVPEGRDDELSMFVRNYIIKPAMFTYGGNVSVMFHGLKGMKNSFGPGMGINIPLDFNYCIVEPSIQQYFGDYKYFSYNISTLVPFFSFKESTPFLGLGIGTSRITAKFPIPGDNSTARKRFTNGGTVYYLKGGYLLSHRKKSNLRVETGLTIPSFSLNNQKPVGGYISLIVLLRR